MQARTPEPFPVTARTRHRLHAERGSHDRALVYAVLDEARICHVGFAIDGEPVVLPMAYARVGDRLVLHGANSNRMLRQLAGGAPLCITVTLLDGLVLARCALRHSMNYRSVMIFGRGEPVLDPGEKRAALDAVVDHYVPERTRQIRASTDAEVDGTFVLTVELAEASAKVRTGPPVDAPEDLSQGAWAGVIPLHTELGVPLPAPDLAPHSAPPPRMLASGDGGSVVQLGSEAAAQGAALAAGAGWRDVPGDWEELLAAGQLFGQRAPDGSLIATGLVCHFGTVSAVGKVLVRADWRRRGLATRMMEACMQATAPDCVLWLSATEQGRPVYERLGFKEIGSYRIMLGKPHWERDAGGPVVRALEPGDLAQVLALDAKALGCRRDLHLKTRLARAHGAVVALDSNGEMEGFALSVLKRDQCGVGPVIASSPAAALALIRGAVGDWAGEVRVDIPRRWDEFCETLRAVGLAPDLVRPEMTLGGRVMPGDAEMRFALCTAASM